MALPSSLPLSVNHYFATIFLLALIRECIGRPIYPLPSKLVVENRQPIQTFRPYNIAHRGSNGELPEETAAAYMRAIEEGADFIETDILATKDGALICFHDVYLDDTTDVAQHKEFIDRKRTYEVQGVNVTGFFTVDFTLDEIKSLRVKQRYPFRDQSFNDGTHIPVMIPAHEHARRRNRKRSISQNVMAAVGHDMRFQYVLNGWEGSVSDAKVLQRALTRQGDAFRVPAGHFSIITFEEYIDIALDAPRVVGIYPEIKNPVFINQHVKWANGKKFEDKFMEKLLKYGYKGAYMSKDWLKQPIFIQSFAPTSLVYVSNLTESPKIFLIDDVTVPTQDTNQSYWEITSDSYFDFIKEYVIGIGPWKDTIDPPKNNHLTTLTDLVAKAHAHNLQVHPYTYRNEYMFLHVDFHQDPYAEYDFWINTVGVDGLFTDFTGSFHNFQEWNSHSMKSNQSATNLLHKIALMVSSYRGV